MLPLLTCLLCVSAPNLPAPRLLLDASPASQAEPEHGHALFSALDTEPLGAAISDLVLGAVMVTAYVLPPLRGKHLGRLALDTTAAAVTTVSSAALLGAALLVAVAADRFRTGSDTGFLLLAALCVAATMTGPLAVLVVDRVQGHPASFGALLATEGIVGGVDLLGMAAIYANRNMGTPVLFTAAMGVLSVWGWSAGAYTLYAH